MENKGSNIDGVMPGLGAREDVEGFGRQDAVHGVVETHPLTFL
jgi:hypothetical protein